MIEEVSADELERKLAAGEDVQVVDIRPPAEFRDGHIPGAVNIPFPEFVSSLDDHEWGDSVVVACPLGESSRQAARLLESYEDVSPDAAVANLAGGYEAWQGDLEREE